MWNQLLLPILTGSIPEKPPNFLENPGIILEISGKNLKNILKNSINQLDSRQLWQ